MICSNCMRRSWRLVSGSSSATVGLCRQSSNLSSGTQMPPIKVHRRQINRLEQAAAIGLAALQQAQQGSIPAAAVPAAAVAGGLPAAPPAVAQLQQKPKKRVGALQKVPVISPSDELAASALKRAVKVQPAAGLKNEADKERSRAAKQLDTHMKELSVPLSRYLKAFPSLPSLHPFEAALLDLTVGTATYTSVLGKVDALRKSLQEVGKGYANRAANAANKRAAAAVAEEGSAALAAVFEKGSKAVEDLKKVSRALRSLPYVDPALPTLALVGAPNVGKSSLVRVLSSGVPEVCNYPFTTRSIKMGHFYINARRHQITDTPGLLQRPDEYRNKMELLTLAALQHLPSSVMFVADLTEECGTSVADQWLIRQELRARFPRKPWVDVLSKADLLQDVWQQVAQQQQQHVQQQQMQHTKRLDTDFSCSGPNISSSSSLQEHIAAAAAAGEEEVAVQQAVQFAAALPDAVRVSSITEQGLVQLQQQLVELLQSPAAAAQLAAGAVLGGGVHSNGSSSSSSSSHSSESESTVTATVQFGSPS